MTFRIGVDLGGTKSELIALDRQGAVRYRKRVSTPADDYQALVGCVVELVHAAEAELGVTASVGVGTPGSPSRTSGLMRNSNTQCLQGRALGNDLGEALGREVRVANDADCFALSESVDGAGRGARIVFGVILGTGVGGGVVVGGRLLQGCNGIAGEWGHNPLPWPEPSELPGPGCYCGRRGCIETFISGTGLARDYRHSAGGAASGMEVAERAREGETQAVAALDRYHNRLARSLATVINLLDPDVIVLGGGVSQIDSLYREVPARLLPWVFSDRVDTPVLPAVHGDASGARGAAGLWPEAE